MHLHDCNHHRHSPEKNGREREDSDRARRTTWLYTTSNGKPTGHHRACGARQASAREPPAPNQRHASGGSSSPVHRTPVERACAPVGWATGFARGSAQPARGSSGCRPQLSRSLAPSHRIIIFIVVAIVSWCLAIAVRSRSSPSLHCGAAASSSSSSGHDDTRGARRRGLGAATSNQNKYESQVQHGILLPLLHAPSRVLPGKVTVVAPVEASESPPGGVPPRCSSSPPRHAIAWVCVFGRGSGAGAAGRELAARRRRTCSGGGRLSSLLFESFLLPL